MAAILSAVQTSHDRGDRDSYLPDRGLGQGSRLGFPSTCGSNLPNLAVRVVGLDRAWGEVRLRPTESAGQTYRGRASYLLSPRVRPTERR